MAAGNRMYVRDDQSWVSDLTPPSRKPRAHSTLARFALSVGVTAVLAAGAVACGSDGTADPGPSSAGSATVGPSAENGARLARSMGCSGCHGRDFDGGAGPTWIGLAGSEVVLVDGTTVVADDDYLTRAIAEPAAELVEGYNLKMPANALSDAEVADIVAYINTLADA